MSVSSMRVDRELACKVISVSHLDRYSVAVRKMWQIFLDLGVSKARVLTLALYSKQYFIDPAQLTIPPLSLKDDDKSLHTNIAPHNLHQYCYKPYLHPEDNDIIATSDLSRIIVAVNTVIATHADFEPLFRLVEHEWFKLNDLSREVRHERGLLREFGILLRVLPDEWETSNAEAAEVYKLWREEDKGAQGSTELVYTGRVNKLMTSDMIQAKLQANKELLDLYMQVTGGFEIEPRRIETLKFVCKDIYGQPSKDEVETREKVKGD